MYTKLVPETVNYISLKSKFICYNLYLFSICTIYLELSAKVFFKLEYHIDEQLVRQ